VKKEHKTLITLVLVGIGMVGVSFAAVPLYRKFCAVTGYLGTTQRVEANTAAQTERTITVSFDANTESDLPWDFGPDQRSVTVKVGETANITYHARNKGDKPMVGEARFNVQPDKAGEYFDKIQCFCFQKQLLKPGESATFPVQFYIDPEILKNHHADDVTDITLSYTFFLAKDQSLANPAAQSSTPKTSTP
jgi:cytochrome c oxidase assembly protein subunit 11